MTSWLEGLGTLRLTHFTRCTGSWSSLAMEHVAKQVS